MKRNQYHTLVCRKGIFRYASNMLLPLVGQFFVQRILRTSGQKMTFLSFLLLFVACEPATKQEKQAEENFNEALFEHKTAVRFAKGFTIDYYDNYKVVNILNHFEERTDTLKYVLVQRGTPKPENFPNSPIMEIPVRSIVAMSSMHIALAAFLESADLIVGLGSHQYVTSPEVRENITAGEVVEVGIGAAANDELLITLRPDVVMAMASPDATYGRYETLTEAGIPVMIFTEWLEKTPLGRTEWVKVMAAMLNKEKLAEEKFDEIAEAYQQYAHLAEKAEKEPVVVSGMPYKGSWFVPDGDSYMGKFLEDAKTSYHWSETTGKGSLALDFESVYPVALTADFWINVGSTTSMEKLAAKDVRYTDFKAYKEGLIFNNNKRINDLGANDYWESGGLNPHIILADLIHIFHPDLLPDHDLVYYKKLK